MPAASALFLIAGQLATAGESLYRSLLNQKWLSITETDSGILTSGRIERQVGQTVDREGIRYDGGIVTCRGLSGVQQILRHIT